MVHAAVSCPVLRSAATPCDVLVGPHCTARWCNHLALHIFQCSTVLSRTSRANHTCYIGPAGSRENGIFRVCTCRQVHRLRTDCVKLCFNADVVLDLNAGMTGSAPPGNAEHTMLQLDDELAGLIEAADTPAGQAGPQSTKPEIVSLMAGEAAFAHSLSARLAKSSGVLCMWVCIAFL